MKILITGGLGYIGSHTVVELISNGFTDILIVDNLSNSSIDVLDNIEEISGLRPDFLQYDLTNEVLVKKVFSDFAIDAIIHFAGLKAVGESVIKPIKYYENNLISTINLLKYLTCKTKYFVFSSSATVYGDPERLPIDEKCRLSVTNPYGRTKLMIEEILADYSVSNPDTSISILRYFNPVGAHESGLIGENPKDIPNNLVPYLSRVARGLYEKVKVFGNDYDTKDGTGIRDYIHVQDLANGHIAALNYLNGKNGVFIHNLGTGKGYSVLDVINTYSTAVGKSISYEYVDRRPGDIAECFADPTKALNELKWKAKYDLKKMIDDTWNYEMKNK